MLFFSVNFPSAQAQLLYYSNMQTSAAHKSIKGNDLVHDIGTHNALDRRQAFSMHLFNNSIHRCVHILSHLYNIIAVDMKKNSIERIIIEEAWHIQHSILISLFCLIAAARTEIKMRFFRFNLDYRPEI